MAFASTSTRLPAAHTTNTSSSRRPNVGLSAAPRAPASAAVAAVLPRRSCRIGAQGGGAGVIEAPEIKQAGWDSDKDINLDGGVSTETGRDKGGVDKLRAAPPGGGAYRVLLLKSPKHTERAVVKAITSTIPNCDEAHARNCYSTSMELGMAIIVSVLKEHAEFYAQQLYRMGCKTAIEPDTAAA